MNSCMHPFSLEMDVRDYECDLQQIVNNSVYQNYFEHARHKFLQSIGLDFAELHNTGIELVVVRAEIDYKYPLRSGDQFLVSVEMDLKGKSSFSIKQSIYLISSNKVMANGIFYGASLKDGHPVSNTALSEAIKKKEGRKNEQ